MALTKEQALSFTHQLDRVANFVDKLAKVGFLDVDVAEAYCRKTDKLACVVEHTAGVARTDDGDLVGPDANLKFSAQDWDPNQIGMENGGPHQHGADEAHYMGGEFSQQENRELREEQQAGNLPPAKDKPQKPTSGKQATLEKLAKMAGAHVAFDLSEASTALRICCAKLKKSALSLASLTSSCERLAGQLDGVKESVISEGGDVSPLAHENLHTIMDAVSEVMPFLHELCASVEMASTDEDSPAAQLEAERIVEQSREDVAKMLGFANSIVGRQVAEIKDLMSAGE